MAREIDERVVEMRFDNKQFEEGAKETVTTLSKLREALDFSKSKKGFEELNKSVKDVNMTQLVDGVTALQKRFSTFGIMSMRAVENVTDSLMGMAHRGVKAVTDSIVSGGIKRAMNLEKAHFQLQSIIGDEEKVQEVLKVANDSVDGTAYSFDVAAKASSQFYASGITDSKTMAKALAGLAGASATFSADYEQMALIWTQVAGKGRVMGDELLQLSSRGANAAAEISKFMNGVNSGAIEASDSVTKAIRSVTTATNISEADLRDMVSKGLINFEIFAEAMNNAFGDSAKKANETFDGALSNIKSALARIGAEFVSPLIEQNNNIVKLFNALRLRINDVKASLTFNEELGNTNALSKRFTDTVLAMAKSLEGFVTNLDLTKPLEIFNDFIDTTINLGKAVGSVILPVGRAIAKVFGKDFSPKNVQKLTGGIADLTSKLILSKKNAKNLQDTFSGLFSIVELLGTAIFKILKAIIPMGQPVGTLSELIVTGILKVTGALGRGISKVTDWISKSKQFNSAFEILGKVVKNAALGLTDLIISFAKFLKYVYNLPETQEALWQVGQALLYLGTKAYKYLEKAAQKVKEFKAAAEEIVPVYVEAAMERFVRITQKMSKFLRSLDLSKPREVLNRFGEALRKLLDMAMANEGIRTFVNNAKKFAMNVKEAFSFDTIQGKIEGFMNLVGKFVTWFKEKVMPLFSGVTVGGAISTGMAGGLLYSLIKMSKAFETLSKSVKTFPNVLSALTGSLKMWQKDIKASIILKIAAAIGILAVSLTILSFADMDRLMLASVALATVSGVFLFGIAALMKAFSAVQKSKDPANRAIDVVNGLGKRLTKSVRDLTKAIKYKAIGSMVKDFGIAIAAIAASIIALALMYRKDSKSVDKALEILGIVTATIVGVVVILSKLQKGIGGFAGGGMLNSALSVLAIALALGLAVNSLRKLFKIELPKDWKAKLGILAGIFIALAALAVGLGKASSLVEGGSGKFTMGPLIQLAAAVYLVVFSLEKLMKMEFTDDWGWRLGILAGIFVAIGALVVVMSKATKGVGGQLKMAGSILAMAVMVGAIVVALGVLMIYPIDKLVESAKVLGALLLAVGAALFGAGKIVEPSTYKSILAMAIMVGAITVALSVLSMVPFEQLKRAAIILGSMLLLTALNFNQIGKISKKNVWKTVGALAITIGAITLSLLVLAGKPWENLLAAGAALSAVLLSLSLAFKVIADSKKIKPIKIAEFLALTLSLIPIVLSLVILSDVPWENLIAASAAISLVLATFAGIFVIVSKFKVDPKGMAALALGTLSIAGIGITLALLATQDWQSILSAAASISIVMLAMSAALAVCTFIGGAAPAAIAGIALLDIFIADLALVLYALGKIFESDGMNQILSNGADVLRKIGEAFGGLIAGFIGKSMEGLESVGTSLSNFMENAKGFFDGAAGIDPAAMEGIKSLAQMLLILTGTEFLNGIANFFGIGDTSLEDFGKQLESFAPSIKTFSDSVQDIDPKSLEGANAAVDVMTSLAKAIPKEGGVLQWITGEGIDLEVFGDDLASFGKAMVVFTAVTAGLSPDSVQQAKDSADMLMELGNATPKTGGLIGWLTGNKDISKFGKNLESFGLSMAAFSRSIVTVNTEKINLVCESMSNFIEVAKKANGVSTEGISNLNNSISSAAQDSASEYAASIGSAGGAVSSAMSGVVQNAIGEISKETKNFQNKGEESTKEYSKGIDKKKTEAKKSTKKVADKAIEGLTEKVEKFTTSGKNAGQGYIDGLKDKIPDAKKAAAKLAKDSQKALADANSEGSPSKIFRKSGIFAGMGYVIGMTRMAVQAYKAGKELGEQSQNGMELGLDRVSRIFDSLDMNPIITPTVDLSGVQKSASSINRMFNNAIHMTANAAGSISMMQRRDETSELISALKGIELQAASSGNNYYIGGIDYSNNRNVGTALEALIGEVIVQGRV